MIFKSPKAWFDSGKTDLVYTHREDPKYASFPQSGQATTENVEVGVSEPEIGECMQSCVRVPRLARLYLNAFREKYFLPHEPGMRRTGRNFSLIFPSDTA